MKNIQTQKLNILVIDRPLKDGETAVKDIFEKYIDHYHLIMMPPKDNDPECRSQFVSSRYNLIPDFEEILHTHIGYDEDAKFYDFDITEIDDDVILDMLNSTFEIILINLTNVESDVDPAIKKRTREISMLFNPHFGAGTGNYCPECGGPCGNSNHDRKKW